MRKPGGPRPEPTALKLLRGNPSKTPKAIIDAEPKPEIGKPTIPAFLDKEAKAEWRRVINDLVTTGVLAKIDRAILAAYCQAWADWKRCCEELSALTDVKGHYLASNANGLTAHPAFKLRDAACNQMLKFAMELGISPAARTRLRVDTSASSRKQNPLAAFTANRSVN